MSMKSIRMLSGILAVAILAACSSGGSVPTLTQAQQIQKACDWDKSLVRPAIDAVTAAGMLTPDDQKVITGARLVIDPICANPTAPVADTVLATFQSNIASLVVLAVQLKERKAAAKQ